MEKDHGVRNWGWQEKADIGTTLPKQYLMQTEGTGIKVFKSTLR